MNQNQVTWKGQSGKQYVFTVYDKKQKFNQVDGNYIFAKQTLGTWFAVYIGEGDLQSRTQDEEHLKCAESKGFTHYHVHVNKNEKERKAEESDLILGNNECLIEKGGCNKTITGK